MTDLENARHRRGTRASPRLCPIARTIARTLAIGVIAASAWACGGTRSDVFLHTTHRIQYAIQPEELEQLQFYISKDVLAHATGAGESPRPEDVIVIDLGTPGLVLESGDRWVRVAFAEGGHGVHFLASHGGTDSAYLLATETGDGGLVRVADLPKPVLSSRGREYRIVYGADAYLRVDEEGLNRLIERRTRAGGLELD